MNSNVIFVCNPARIVKRKEDHERDDYNGKTIDAVFTLQCKDMKTAADVEMIMRFRYGFCIGEGQGTGH